MNQFKLLTSLAAAAVIAAFSHLSAAEVASPAPEPCGLTRALRTIQWVELVKKQSSGRDAMAAFEQMFRQGGD